MIAVDEARKWIGTPYEHAGRMLGVGVDCVGVIVGVAKSLGIVEEGYRTPFYEPFNDGSLIGEIFPRYASEIAAEQIQPGDVVVMEFLKLPQHTAIVGDAEYGLRSLSIIHAYYPMRQVIEQPLDEKWLRRIVQAWRVQWVS